MSDPSSPWANTEVVISSVLPSEIARPKYPHWPQLIAALAAIVFTALLYIVNDRFSVRTYLIIVAVTIMAGSTAMWLLIRRFVVRARPPGEHVVWERTAWIVSPHSTHAGGVFILYFTGRGLFIRSTAVKNMESAADGALTFHPPDSTQLTLYRPGPSTLFLEVAGESTLWFKFALFPWLRRSLQRALERLGCRLVPGSR